MRYEGVLVATGLAGFHVAVTLLALYRARHALRLASHEGRGDRRTMWRLATLRLVAAIVILSGAVLAFAVPLYIALTYAVALLPTTSTGIGILMAGAWFVWIPATILLDNLAWRWLKRADTSRS